jgi:class 3 adenylate cyclase
VAAGGGVRFGLRWRVTAVLTCITLVVMGVIAGVMSTQIRNSLSDQITTRGLALSRNLADSAVEPLQTSKELDLALALLVKEYVQTGGTKETRDRMALRETLARQIWAAVQRRGKPESVEGVRNEGVLSAQIVDPAGTVLAYADAVSDQMAWFDKVGQPFPVPMGAALLSPQESFRIWSIESSNSFLIAVPIRPQSAGPGAVEAPAAGAAGTAVTDAVAAGQSPFLGAVYLQMSKRLVERTVASALATLIIVAGTLVGLGVLVALVIAAVLTKPIRLLTDGVRAIAGGDFNQRIPLKRADELGDLTDAFNEMAKGLAERELMDSAFSKYVSKDLLAEIIKNPDAMKLGGSRKEATVMFTFFGNHHDLPALMSKIDPAEFVRIINAYLELQTTVIKEHQGHIDKFVGEEVMAVWGTTAPLPDHPEWAVKAALAIQRGVTALNADRAKRGLMTTEISIGINTGSMVAGNMGSATGKRDYTVISSDVNYAARLSGAGAIIHPGEIWVGESTWQRVQHIAELKEKKDVTFKGIPGAQPVYVIAGLKAGVAAGA